MAKEKIRKQRTRPKFIVIDGGEGSGKTTMCETLPAVFPKGKLLLTHEPGGTPLAETIRTVVLSEGARASSAETQFGLMWAARAEHLHGKIMPALAEGKTVISDRFDSSTFAYQIYGGEAKYLEKLFWETRTGFLRGIEPDLYVFFDVPPDVGLERIAARRGNNYFDKRAYAFHERVREGYLEFLKYVPHMIIDANRPLEVVKKEFLKCFQDVLQVRVL